MSGVGYEWLVQDGEQVNRMVNGTSFVTWPMSGSGAGGNGRFMGQRLV